jgi:hypothetical protein
MADVALNSDRSYLRDKFNKLICWTTFIVILASLISMLYAKDDGAKWLYFAILAGALVMLVIIAILADTLKHTKYPRFHFVVTFIPRVTRGFVDGFSTWFTLLGATTLTCAALLSQTPYRVHGYYGSILLLDDGRSVSQWQSAVTGRYASIRTIALEQRFNGTVSVRDTKNITYRTDVSGTIWLRTGPALNAYLLKHHADILKSNSHVQAMGAEAIEPMTMDVVRDVQDGRLSGSSAGMLFALGKHVDAHRDQLPAWVNRIEVDSIEAQNWSLTN